MVDSVEHLDLVDAALGTDHPDIRIALELDVSWRPVAHRSFLHIGTRRSPVHTAGQAEAFAKIALRRKGFTLVGMMGYEGQIAGLGDVPPGRPLRGAALKFIQKRSGAELVQRRDAAVAAVRALTELEFVNGGGTGSIEVDLRGFVGHRGRGRVGVDRADAVRCLLPVQAAARRCCTRCRWCASRRRTRRRCSSGGYVASGTGTPDRLPSPYLPAGLSLLGTEGAGEVQTPVTGKAARRAASWRPGLVAARQGR